jgi:hypothetical protein
MRALSQPLTKTPFLVFENRLLNLGGVVCLTLVANFWVPYHHQPTGVLESRSSVKTLVPERAFDLPTLPIAVVERHTHHPSAVDLVLSDCESEASALRLASVDQECTLRSNRTVAN